jgi:hypothetical protein
MKRGAICLLLLVLAAVTARAQDAAPPERTLEIHLHALSRGYMRPLVTTLERIAALPGISAVTTDGYAGDVLRLTVTTTLNDDGLAAAFQLRRVGGNARRVVLAPDDSERVMRAEARAVLLEIARAIAQHPKPEWGRPTEPLFAQDSGLEAQLRVLGLNVAIARGVHYMPADYHLEEEHERFNVTYRLWAGSPNWSPEVLDDPWSYMGRRGSEPSPYSPRFVGLQITRSSWQDETRWVDRDGARMNTYPVTRAETMRGGKLVVQDGAEWMTRILSRAVAVHVADPRRALEDMPRGRGWAIFNAIEANELQRWNADVGFHNNCLEMSWQVRDSDDHWICKLTAFHDGHPFFLHAEVDATAVASAYAGRKEATAELREAELGTALVWVVGAESGPEVFVRRRAEASAAMERLLKALKAKVGQGSVDAWLGALTPERAAGLDPGLKFELFAAGEYTITRQALGDVEIAVGSPKTGGRRWLLGNVATGKIIRSDR